MIPRVTTVEAAAEPPVVPPVAPVEPVEPAELAAPFCAPEVFDAAAPPPLEAAPDVLSPEGAAGLAVLALSAAVAADVALAALAFSSS
mgnify:CR=1 FL=1